MPEAWVRILCPACDRTWEASLSNLPGPDSRFECNRCGETRQTAEFMRSQRDFEILKRFHET